MKKVYIAPSTTLYEVKTACMLALSANPGGPQITDDNGDDFEVLSNRKDEGYWSDGAFSSSSWE